MKLLTTSLVSAAILAAASFGANAQTQPLPQTNTAPANKQAPAGGGAGGGAAAPEMRGGAGGAGGAGGQAAQPGQPGGRDAQAPAGSERPARADTGEKPGAKGADGKAMDSKAADSKTTDGKTTTDTKDSAQKPAGDSGTKAADQGKAGADKQATKEIKPEQKTVIRQTIVQQNIKPAKIDVQVRVGVAIPRTVVLHPLPPAIIEIYPSYRSYRIVLVDDNTILVIDPDTWTIVDIIEV
jgi:hypothetical protein